MSLTDLQKRLADCKQSHLLQFWEELNQEERANFLEQLQTICFDATNELFCRAIKSLEPCQKLDERMKAIPETQFESEESCDTETLEKYRQIGLREIGEGRVAVLLMAGGQGSRLGVSYPKGMYSVDLPSGKSLFRLQAERIRRLQFLAERQAKKSGRIPWYIMTSGPTNQATRQYLEKHKYFGLEADDVILFEQSLLPCFSMNGKILLEDKNKVALAPDGNGGIYGALYKNGILDNMKKRGVRYVHVHSVDNILVKVADPIFIGYCVSKGADCGAKVVKKNSPTEAVGVVCKVDDHFQVVEYSEISTKTAQKTDTKGNLLFNAGNICNHFFTTDFLHDIIKNHESNLKLHVAKKKIPHVDENGVKIKPKDVNGIKIEKFVFDVFKFSNHFVTWEVPRGSEFSALKNSDDAGKDCPATAKRDLLALHKRYIEKAGGIVEGEEVEISPLISYAGEDLDGVVRGKVFKSPMVLSASQEQQINGHYIA